MLPTSAQGDARGVTVTLGQNSSPPKLQQLLLQEKLLVVLRSVPLPPLDTPFSRVFRALRAGGAAEVTWTLLWLLQDICHSPGQLQKALV